LISVIVETIACKLIGIEGAKRKAAVSSVPTIDGDCFPVDKMPNRVSRRLPLHCSQRYHSLARRPLLTCWINIVSIRKSTRIRGKRIAKQ